MDDIVKTICKQCGNNYPINQFTHCSVCKIALNKPSANQTHQDATTHGENSPIAQADNGGSVKQHVGHVYINKDKTPTITYTKHIGDKSFSLTSLLSIPSIISLPGIFLGVFHFLGSSASLISIFDDPSDPFARPALGIIFLVIALISIGLASAALFYWGVLAFGERILVPGINKFLEKQEDGTVRLVWFTAPCKTGKCTGELRVKRTSPNEQDIRYAGYCSENTPQHRYSFDRTQLIGAPITLTPKKDPPKSSD